MNVEEIRTALQALADRDVVLFGSFVRGQQTPRSDVDVAVITGQADRRQNLDAWSQLLTLHRSPFDLHIFELLPVHVRADIAKQHQVLFGDRARIGEAFHRALRDWRDKQHRYEKPLPVRQRIELLRGRSP